MNCIKCGAVLPEEAVFCHLCGKKQVQSPRKAKKRTNGQGCITKLSGRRSKPWQAKMNGVYIGVYSTRLEAERALTALMDTNITDRINLTLLQVYELWLPEHSRTITKGAITSYKSALKQCEELHHRRFRNLRHSDFQSVIIRMENDGYSRSSCEKVLQLFGQLSEWSIREGITQVNHAKYVTIVAQQKSTGQVFTPADIKAIKESELPAADIALVLLATGCRPVELFSAPRDNCSQNFFIGGSKTESGKNRVIPVAAIGLAAYQKILQKSAGKKRLIDGYDGNKTYANFAKRDFKDLMTQIGREGYTPYDCRHTFITTATKNGMDPQILRRIVGHADLATTDKYYTHLDATDLIAAIELYNPETLTVSNKLSTNEKRVRKNA